MGLLLTGGNKEQAHGGVSIPFLDMSASDTDSTQIKTYFCAVLYFASIKTYTRKLYKSSQKPDTFDLYAVKCLESWQNLCSIF